MEDLLPDLAQGTAEDRAAIADVIRRETTCFRDNDFDGWAACRLHSPRATDISTAPGMGVTVVSGWEAIRDDMARSLAEGGNPCGMVDFRQDNMVITVRGSMAWAVFDAWAKSADGNTWSTCETRVLEKTEDGWRIALLSFAVERDSLNASGHLAVDAKGNVIWKAPGADALLMDHPALTVSHGRLRARRGPWDKVLQAALQRAGKLHGFYQHRRFLHDTGAPFRTPVVLGENDSGSAVVCALVVKDGITYLDIDPFSDLDRRLATAQAIFALSHNQTELAGRIARGDTLGHAAKHLGISVNTARTHLARIYEKTGVNAQTALVRLLLSVG